MNVLILNRHQGAAAAVAEGADRLVEAQRWDLVDAGRVGDKGRRAGCDGYGPGRAVVRCDHAFAANA